MSTGEKILTLNREGYSRIGNKFKYAHTDDYTPLAAIGAAQTVIENEANRFNTGEMYDKMFSAMKDVFKSFGIVNIIP